MENALAASVAIGSVLKLPSRTMILLVVRHACRSRSWKSGSDNIG
jgi:hypothetical protein